MAHRFNNVLKLTNSNWGPAASNTVTAYPRGAIVSDQEINQVFPTVYPGHGFVVDDYFFINTDTTVTHKVTVSTPTQLTVTPALTVFPGDVLVNIGADTLAGGTIDWDGSNINIYTEYSMTTSPVTEARVTTNSDGEYSYYTRDGSVWEIVRDSGGILVDVIQGWEGFNGASVPATFTSGDATPSVLHGNTFKTAGTTAITAFDNPIAGQIIRILAETSITITDGAALILNGSANFDMVAEDTLSLLYDGSAWREIARNDMA